MQKIGQDDKILEEEVSKDQVPMFHVRGFLSQISVNQILCHVQVTKL